MTTFRFFLSNGDMVEFSGADRRAAYEALLSHLDIVPVELDADGNELCGE